MMALQELRRCWRRLYIYKRRSNGPIRSLTMKGSERMTVLSISVLLLLCCHCTTAILSTFKLVATPLIVTTKCTDANKCPFADYCRVCPDGWGPTCAAPTCILGRCGTTRPCSQSSSDASTTVTFTTSSPSQQCTEKDTSRCIKNLLCARCLQGYSPGCTEAVCVNGQCKVIAPCSVYTPVDPSTSTAATTLRDGKCRQDIDCAYPGICGTVCKDGFGPRCTSGSCVNGQCVVIPACSVKTLVTKTTVVSPSSTTSNLAVCQTDGECSYVKMCVAECADGSQPLCAYSRCIGGQCVVTAPCSQKTRCTDQDVSQCIVPQFCADCVIGLSPGCAQASCENGQCKVIAPCSIGISTLTKKTATPRTMVTRTMITRTTKKITISTPINGCTSSSQCVRPSLCVANCSDGMTPLCPSAKCVEGKCIAIAPCSQRTCKTSATCPFTVGRCAACIKGYGPACEQAACNCGVCAVVPPCSEQLVTLTAVPAVPDIWDGSRRRPIHEWTKFL